MKPLVSILIPAFNAQNWIVDTLRSALAQTWEPKEIIVVDDGSTDRTLEGARQFESEGVRVVTQKNQGAAATRNNAFAMSRGSYIQWLDADDLLSPDKISLQMSALDPSSTSRTLLSSAWGSFMYRPYKAEFRATELWRDLSPAEWLLRKLGLNLYMQTATWLVSRELSEAAGAWDTRLLSDDDGEYFCRVLLACDGVRFVRDAKVYYRTSGASSLSYIGQSPAKVEAYWYSMKLHMKYLRSLEDSKRTRDACLKYLTTSAIYFYPERPDILKQIEEMALALGGSVGTPSLSWKYAWIKKAFGWELAKRCKFLLPKIKWSAIRHWDKMLYLLQGKTAALRYEDVR